MSTITDVAKEAGVSITTVSLVLNGKMAARKETRERVLDAAARLSYKPNNAARALSSREEVYVDSVGVIMPFENSPLFHEKWYYQIISGIGRVLHDAGKHLVLGWTQQLNGEHAIPRMLHEKRIERLILFFSSSFKGIEGFLENIKDFGIPAVVIEYPSEKMGFTSILLDMRQAAYAASLRLIEEGYSSVASITGPLDYFPAKERFDGYRLALVEKNYPLDDGLVFEGNFSEQSGYAGMEKIMRRAEPPLGVFAANDDMAKGALKYLEDNEINVPGEVGIIGFDNIPEIVNSTRPNLSSVNAHWDRMGEEAARQALFIKDNDSARNIIISCDLALRESSSLGKEVVLK